MIEIIGSMGAIAGMICLAIWLDQRNQKGHLFFGLVVVLSGLYLIIVEPKIESETPTYSSEWIDEETRCHWYGGKLINCETVRYMEGLCLKC